MDEKILEKIISNSIQIGVINTLNRLGLVDENISAQQAYKTYGKRQVEEWRRKRWIVGYPTGNSTRAKYYFKRSELETACRMLDIHNVIPGTVMHRIMESNHKSQLENEKRKASQNVPSKL